MADVLPPYLQSDKDASILKVLLAPRASRNKILGEHDGFLKVAVTAPPVEGEANEALVKFFSELLHVSKTAVTIERGHTSKRKTLRIEGISPSKIIAILDESAHRD